MSQDNQTLSHAAPKASRRGLLIGFAAAAAPMAPALADALGGLPGAAAGAAAVDPIFAVIVLHREAVLIHEEARELCRELAANDDDPAPFLRKGSPRNLACNRWNSAVAVIIEVSDRLFGMQPTSFDGAVAALEYSVEFMEIANGNDDYDFLSFDCHSEFVGNIAAALRNMGRVQS
jgi:hypothetical protein